MQLAVYVFGHGEIVREYFNAIAAMIGSSQYATALRIAILLAGFTVIFQYIFRRSLLDIARWFLLYYVVFYVVLAPKVTVVIKDNVTQRALPVDNVPLGIAVIAHYTSALGTALTNMTETTFSLPGDLRYGQSGMVMASRLVTASAAFQIPHPVFNENMQGFVQQCVFYDLLLNKYTLSDIQQEPNLWAFLREKASPARMFPYTPLSGGKSTLMTCKEGLSPLNSDWQKLLQDAQRLYGARLFPYHQNPAQQFARYIPVSYRYLLNASGNAASILQQTMLSNVISNTAMRFSSTTDAPAALQAFITAKTHMQERLTYQTMGERAAHWLPLLKNALEAILYGAFVIVLLLMVFPFGAVVLRHYVFSLVWLQTWSPLYAIINLMVSYYAKQSSFSTVGKEGMTLQNLEGIFSINADMASLAGYLSLSVPMLAFGLVRGMAGAFSSMTQYAGGVMQSVSAQVAAEGASGNISVGNTSFETHSAFNTSMNHLDTMGRFVSGGMSMQMAGGSSLTLTAGGTTIMDTRMSNLGSHLQLSDSVRSALMQNAETSYQAAFSKGQSYQSSVSEGMRNLYELADAQSRSQASGESTGISNHAGFNESVGTVQRLTQEFAERNNISYAEASNVLTQAQVHAGIRGSVGTSGLGGKLSGSLSLGANGSRSSTDTTSTHSDQIFSEAQNFIRDSNYSTAVDTATRATQESSFRASSDESQRLANSTAASFDTAHQARQDMSSHLQKSDSYRQAASFAQENAVSINSNASQAMFEWMKTQRGTNGSGSLISRFSDMEAMQQNDPELFAMYAKQFSAQYSNQMASSWQGQHAGSSSGVEKIHQGNNQAIPSDSSVESGYKTNQQQINQNAGKQGLGHGTIVNSSIKKDAGALQQTAQQQKSDSIQQIKKSGDQSQKTVKIENEKPLDKYHLWSGLVDDK